MKKLIWALLFVAFFAIPFGVSSTHAAKANVMSGAWIGQWPSTASMNIEKFNQITNRKSNIIHTFVNTNQDINQWGFMDYVKAQGAKNMLTLETRKSDWSGYTTVEINSGMLDSYFAKIATQLKDWQGGEEIWMRILHEGNGNWYGWSLGDSKVNTNATYKKAFIRMVSIFRENGATNVKFIYNVNNTNAGSGASYMGAYPGDKYVDYVSVDGYNWGNTQSWSKWQSFRNVFDSAYKALTKGSSKKVIIAEYASSEVGGNKAEWIKDAKKQMNSGAYPKLVAEIWFNETLETDWRINSSKASLIAYGM